jgi:hypothetical protein
LETQKQEKESYKIKEKHVKYALDVLKKQPTLSISMLKSKLVNKFSDFDISQGHLAKVIRDNNLTRKRTKTRHYPETRYRKPIDMKKEIKAFYKITDKYSLDKIISIDETSIHAQITNSYSRCELGKRCIKKTTKNTTFRKYTLVCAINSKGIVGYELYEKGGMNTDRMIAFVNKFIKGKYINNLIIMDNGGSHKSSKIKICIEGTQNKLQYSVPYKPQTNAIENFFSQLKHYFGYEEDKFSYIELLKSVKNAFRKIKKSNYRYFMLCFSIT